jgi:hypothetical protein
METCAQVSRFQTSDGVAESSSEQYDGWICVFSYYWIVSNSAKRLGILITLQVTGVGTSPWKQILCSQSIPTIIIRSTSGWKGRQKTGLHHPGLFCMSLGKLSMDEKKPSWIIRVYETVAAHKLHSKIAIQNPYKKRKFRIRGLAVDSQ